MHHHDCPPLHVVDYAKIARIEREIWHRTFHHSDRHCRCDDCVARRDYEDAQLQLQTARAIAYEIHDLKGGEHT